jgi:hypothetical protein
MKKQVLLFSSLLASLTLTAQTWTADNEAEIGETKLMYSVDTSITNYSNLTGAGQTWDYSFIAGYENNTTLISITDPSSGAYATNFPSSTHSIIINDFVETFYTLDNTIKASQGYVFNVDGVGEILINLATNNQTMLTFPTNSSTSISDEYSGTLSLNGDSNPAEGYVSIVADGTGTLKLPNNVTHTEVLRIHSVDTTYGAVLFMGFLANVTIIRDQYDYLKGSESSFNVFSYTTLTFIYPLLNTMQKTTQKIVLSSENPTGFVGLKEESISSFKLYPNPTNGNSTVFVPEIENTTIHVTDALGKTIRSFKPTTNETSIDLTNEPKGLYFVQYSTENELKTLKLIVK